MAAIGTGIAGFPIERCAVVMLAEIRDHLRGATTLEKVEMVLFDERGLGVFQDALAKMADLPFFNCAKARAVSSGMRSTKLTRTAHFMMLR